VLAFYVDMIPSRKDQIRYDQIYFEYRKQMYAAAFRILRNKEDAEDAVQNALLGIARNMHLVPVRMKL